MTISIYWNADYKSEETGMQLHSVRKTYSCHWREGEWEISARLERSNRLVRNREGNIETLMVGEKLYLEFSSGDDHYLAVLAPFDETTYSLLRLDKRTDKLAWRKVTRMPELIGLVDSAYKYLQSPEGQALLSKHTMVKIDEEIQRLKKRIEELQAWKDEQQC